MNLSFIIYYEWLILKKITLSDSSDGLKIGELIGTVTAIQSIAAMIKRFVNPVDFYSVYIIKLVGISPALDQVLNKKWSFSEILIPICINNEATLEAIDNPSTNLRQFFLISIYENICQRPTYMEIYWISKHKRIQGIKYSHRKAKAAAKLRATKHKKLLRAASRNCNIFA